MSNRERSWHSQFLSYRNQKWSRGSEKVAIAFSLPLGYEVVGLFDTLLPYLMSHAPGALHSVLRGRFSSQNPAL